MCLTLVDQSLLQRAIALGALSPLRGLRVEPEAPATTPDTVVSLDQPGKGVPGVGAKRFDRVLSHVGSVDPIADGGRPVCRRLANPIPETAPNRHFRVQVTLLGLSTLGSLRGLSYRPRLVSEMKQLIRSSPGNC